MPFVAKQRNRSFLHLSGCTERGFPQAQLKFEVIFREAAMSHRWLLSLLCLSVLSVMLVPLTRARGELRVNETRTKLLLEPTQLLLAVENSTGETLKAKVDLKVLDPRDRSIAEATSVQTISTGNQSLTLSLPLSFSKLEHNAQRDFLWHRLHYRLSREGGPEVLAEGVVSLSEITPGE